MGLHHGQYTSTREKPCWHSGATTFEVVSPATRLTPVCSSGAPPRGAPERRLIRKHPVNETSSSEHVSNRAMDVTPFRRMTHLATQPGIPVILMPRHGDDTQAMRLPRADSWVTVQNRVRLG
ncbi:hypothetical protein MVI01_06960 [Myxococcus virescens]|uniref:Uncharacterized protein n=1 Tax=Myxococcus virescens TaxID=83456 RepID=A0A511H5W9_9BACT|nr:hypothetical protein MVI01_06960 [Myxococcus virescens]